MAAHPEAPLEELTWTIAAARLLLGPAMSVQAPPNLTPEGEGAGGGAAAALEAGWRALIDAGINDFGAAARFPAVLLRCCVAVCAPFSFGAAGGAVCVAFASMGGR